MWWHTCEIMRMQPSNHNFDTCWLIRGWHVVTLRPAASSTSVTSSSLDWTGRIEEIADLWAGDKCRRLFKCFLNLEDSLGCNKNTMAGVERASFDGKHFLRLGESFMFSREWGANGFGLQYARILSNLQYNYGFCIDVKGASKPIQIYPNLMISSWRK